jgi:hypothetical protein
METKAVMPLLRMIMVQQLLMIKYIFKDGYPQTPSPSPISILTQLPTLSQNQ